MAQSPKTETHSAGVDKPAPSLTAESNSEIQALVISVQANALQLGELEKQYQQVLAKNQDLQKKLTAAKTKAMKTINADDKLYEIQITAEGVVVLVTKPVEKK